MPDVFRRPLPQPVVHLSIAVLVATVFALAACSVAPSGVPSSTIIVWVDTPAIGASLQTRIQPFLKANPNLQVKIFNQAGRIKNGDISTAIEALSGSELSPDVVALTDLDFRLMSNTGDLVDLSPYILAQSGFATDDYFPGVMDAFRLQGKQYAIPTEVVPWMIYYNKDAFDKAHLTVPETGWTVSQFVADGEQLQGQTNGKQQLSGFVADPTVAMLPFAEAFGAQPQDGAQDPYANWVTDPKTVAGVDWFAGLNLRNKVMPFDAQNRSQALWVTGNAGMGGMFMSDREQLPAFLRRRLDELTPSPTGTPAFTSGWHFNWNVVLPPKAEVQTTVYYVNGYGIPQTSHDPQNAWLLINYLSQHLPDNAALAYVPARESLAYSSGFDDLYPESGRDAYREAVLIGNRLPALPPAAQLTLQDIQGVMDGSTRPFVMLQAYRDRIQPMLVPRPPPTPTPIGQN